MARVINKCRSLSPSSLLSSQLLQIRTIIRYNNNVDTMLHVAGSLLFNCYYRHSSWWNVYNFCTTYDGFQRYNILLVQLMEKSSIGVLYVVNISSNISISSCCPHLLLYKVMRPAFKPIGDKVCSWTLSSSPWHCSRPCKNVKRVPTWVCQPHALAFLFMEFDITWTRETSFPRFLKFLATLLSVCAKYDNVCVSVYILTTRVYVVLTGVQGVTCILSYIDIT